MKKFNVLICILMVLFTLTACGGTEEVAEDTTTTAPTTVTTTLPISTTDVATETVTTIESTTQTTTAESTATVATTSVTTTESTTIYTTTKATTTNPTTTTVPTTQTTTETKDYCTVKIECNTIYDNLPKLKSGKQSFLPTSGVIIDDAKVELKGDESAFDVIKKACEENVCTDSCKYCKSGGVQIEYTYTPAFNNYYIEGIHQIYEKDCGTQSGWMFSVNGDFPDVGTSSYAVLPGDVIVLSFTCNMGEDIGNTY